MLSLIEFITLAYLGIKYFPEIVDAVFKVAVIVIGVCCLTLLLIGTFIY